MWIVTKKSRFTTKRSRIAIFIVRNGPHFTLRTRARDNNQLLVVSSTCRDRTQPTQLYYCIVPTRYYIKPHNNTRNPKQRTSHEITRNIITCIAMYEKVCNSQRNPNAHAVFWRDKPWNLAYVLYSPLPARYRMSFSFLFFLFARYLARTNARESQE